MRYSVIAMNGGEFVLDSPFSLKSGDRVLFSRLGEISEGIVIGETSSNSQGLILGKMSVGLSEPRLRMCRWLKEWYSSPIHLCFSTHFPPDIMKYFEKKVVSVSPLVEIEEKFEVFLEKEDVKSLERMVRGGLVEVKEEFISPQIEYERESLVRLADLDEVFEKLEGYEEKKLVEYVLENEPLSVSELLSHFSRKVVKNALRKGILAKHSPSRKIGSRKIDFNESCVVIGDFRRRLEFYAGVVAEKKTLILVPEVSHIPQLLRILEPFGETGVFHSYMSSARRANEWWRAVSGKVDIMIGSRSAVFIPAKWDLVIVEEEHSDGYYQHDRMVYDTIEILKILSDLSGSKLILGSAVPRIEESPQFPQGKMTVVKMGWIKRPETEIVDMRTVERRMGFAIKTLEEIERMLELGETVVIFSRRKGYGRVICERCGYVVKCDRCEVAMTYHKDKGMFKCHFCGREITAFDVCPVCGWTLKVIGTGTERIEESLKRMFKDKSVVRVDADSMTSPDRIVEVLDALRRGRIDILVGTRMVVGGIKLEGVKLVVVTDIDGMLAMPDYSSRLRTFQLLVEISEMMEGGKVIVQHYGMDPDFLRYVERWDIEGFYEDEMRRRCEAKYPPCGDVVQAIYSSSDEKLAEDMVREVARELNEEEVLGPAPYAVPKLRGKYVYHFLVKTDNTPTVLRKLEKIISRYDRRNWKILRNPPSLVLL